MPSGQDRFVLDFIKVEIERSADNSDVGDDHLGNWGGSE